MKSKTFPNLPREEIRKMAEELSNPNLKPKPFTYNWKRILADKGSNSKVVEEITHSIEEEKKIAYQAGREEAKREITQKIQDSISNFS